MFASVELKNLGEELQTLIKKFCFGKSENKSILLNYFEIYFLKELNKSLVIKTIDSSLLSEINSFISKNFYLYCVFKDLVNKNLVVRSGLKYGAHFRVYFKKDFENKEHSKYLVYALKPKQIIKSEELISLFRTAHSVKKRVLLAFVDEEYSIVYYENKWLRI
jgi:tRNA-intron endonuclease